MKNIIEEKWDEILQYLISEYGITDVSYNTWLKPLKVYDVKDHVITILINDERIGPPSLNVIRNKYELLLKVSIEEIMNDPYEIKFVLASQMESIERNAKIPSGDNKIVPNFLNPRYTFDTFVVGGNNEFARAAALAVAENPGEIYNPLFIYGGVGLGKTHLMHSIAHFVLNQNPDMKVLYVTSEKFTNELIDAIQKKTTTHFREKYRSIDILLIDDIQFIIGKESTQEEFFHTFNTLHESKRQIIISSDRPPKEMLTLEDRLRSRFEHGLMADIQSPDYETRMAILKKKEELDGYSIDEEVLKYIATNIKSNIRELEGALTKIVAFSRLKKRELNLELAIEALQDIISPNEKKVITPDLIVDIVAEHFNISPADIYSKDKSRAISYPRQIVMYLCRRLTELSVTEIGKALGNRDHSTVIHGCDKISKDIQKDTSIHNTVDVLIKKINPE
ncbi:chromosomal replication initiator protein DnaA [Herbinix luporum]|uniref:Chromosomal replication initiator protein DnaA n=1 Tax=Herbinix luporum TaxID=1679721 RepID=A0A0K8J1N8_9FIRM|nr:chromosomal replication initiator protein DnaA [Herbinix luporum]MDI9488328.1 chromosomal replication initiator protein DnaA [Bacillota bacterium]CUH91576.1 Chromosomal replication initiator protein DnaA [Herbinix luporum]HHT57758.1 chromosomal replication initiator protein DnaA [Herbinix luporum]